MKSVMKRRNKDAIKKIEVKRQREMTVVTQMITLYCRGNHKEYSRGHLCQDCAKLAKYARSRSEHCPFMETKTFCSSCPVHCYNPKMREKIRQVMRYSGPRMIMHHPIMCVWHICVSIQDKRKLRREIK